MRITDTLEGGNIRFTDSPWLNFFLSLILQLIWSNLDDFSFMMINTMIGMKVPGVGNLIQEVILNLIQVDILMTNKWLFDVFTYLNIDYVVKVD